MACFTAPAVVAIITTIFRKKIPARYQIRWLNMMLWGGVVGLALEHIAHGEITPYPPFLTAMTNPADTAAMIHEIMTIGVGMILACFGVWVMMILIVDYIRASAKTEVTQKV